MTAIFSLKTSNLLDFRLHSTKMFDLQINSDLVFETNFRSCTIFDLLWKKCMKDQSYRGNMHFKFQKTILSMYYNLHIKLAVALECLQFCSFKSYTTRENSFQNQKTQATKLFDPELKATDRSIEIVLRGGPPLVDEF